MTTVRYLGFALLAIVLAVPAIAQQVVSAETNRLISVAGEGKTMAAPDMATIRTGVVSQAETARAALDENNTAMQEIISVLQHHGVADKDVQTSAFHVTPVYQREDRPGPRTKVIGHRVHNEVQVRVRELARLGDVLDGLVRAGSNQISGITFDIANPARVMGEARRRAIRDARARANDYAEAADVAVGRVLQIREQPVEWPRPVQMGYELRTADAAVPIATGEQEFNVTVHVLFELRQGDD